MKKGKKSPVKKPGKVGSTGTTTTGFVPSLQFRFACGLLRQSGKQNEALDVLFKCRDALVPLSSETTADQRPSPDNKAYLLANIYTEIARVLELRSQAAEARSNYQSALEAFPRHYDAHMGMWQLLREQGNGSDEETDEAEAHVRAALNCGYCSERERLVAQDLLALMLCQEGKDSEVNTFLGELGYKYRLSRHVLHYQQLQLDGFKADPEAPGYVRAIDQAFPQEMVAHLQDFFKPDARFWSEHNYGPNTGYFSYVHPLLQPNQEPATSMDQIIAMMHAVCLPLFPQLAEARVAEWWAHCRPHSHGHQLHFDSDDEGRGGLRHPIASTVIYLSENTGGPTMVTTQRMNAGLAKKGWIAFPHINRVVCFDGKVLHGVIPGRRLPNVGSGRRITLMVAFWPSIQQRQRVDGKPGSAMAFPGKDSTYTWPSSLKPQPEWAKLKSTPKEVPVIPLASVWETVGEQESVDKLTAVPAYDVCFQGF